MVETRVPVPLIDMQMMRARGVWTANVVAAFVGFGLYASLGFLPQLLQTPPAAGYGFGASITESGHILLPSAAASFLMGFTTAPLIRIFGARLVVVTGCLATVRGLRVDRVVAQRRPGSCTPPPRCRASAPGWSSRAWPAW